MGYRTSMPIWSRANGPFASDPETQVTGQDSLAIGGQTGTTGHRVEGDTCYVFGGRFCNIEAPASACIICGNEGNTIESGSLNGCFGCLDTRITGGQSTAALGGDDNRLGGDFCTMLGGVGNLITNCDRCALVNAQDATIDAFVHGAIGIGQALHIHHNGACVIGDDNELLFHSARPNELAVRMAGGMRLSLDGSNDAFQIEPGGAISAGDTVDYASKVQDDNDLPNWAKVKQAIQQFGTVSVAIMGQPTDVVRNADIQLLDVDGQPLAQHRVVTAWISSAPFGTPNSSAIVINTIQDGLGYSLRDWGGSFSSWNPAMFVTDDQGRLRFDLENQESFTDYCLHVETGGQIVTVNFQLGPA